MKKIAFALMFLFVSLFYNFYSNAQSPCSAVSVEVIESSFQSGQFKNWGIRVFITQPYHDDITVEGTIEGGFAELWTLTIPAGNTSAQTSNNYYQTDPVTTAVATITSVSACPEPSVFINSSGGVVIKATNLVTDQFFISRKIEIIDSASNEVFGTFINEIVPERFDMSLSDQLQQEVFTGFIYIKENEEIVDAYHIINGVNDLEGSILRIDPVNCTWGKVRGCVRGTINSMNWVAYGICLAGAHICYGGIWASCMWDCLNSNKQ